MKTKKDGGFTLIELTIAIALFGFILLAMTQVIRQEVNLYHQINLQEQKEQNVRTAMQIVLDQFGLKSYKYFQNGSVYYTDKSNNNVLLLANNPVSPTFTTTMTYYNKSLYYYNHLVAANIILSLSQELGSDSEGYYHFTKIDIKTVDGSFQLSSMARLN